MFVEQSSTKREILERLLEQGMVLVTLDAREDSIEVPEHLRGDPQLRLNLSYRFGLPMKLEEDGVHATLTFGGVPYQCVMPWKSLYMYISHATGEPYLFPADIPDEAAAAILALENAMPRTPAKPQKPKLRVVSAPNSTAESKPQSDESQVEEPTIAQSDTAHSNPAQTSPFQSSEAGESNIVITEQKPKPKQSGGSNKRSRAHLRVVK